MASKGTLTKARLSASMLTLIQENGYSGTGLNAITEHAEAPRGSIYFHYPDGKEALGVAAIELATVEFGDLLTEAAASTGGTTDAIRAAIEVLSDIVSTSDFRLGCPVSVVTLEMGAESERLRQACAVAFESWITPTAQLLEANGVPAADAKVLSTAIVSMVEGAVIVSRALRSVQPLEAAADAAELLLRQSGSAA